MITIYEGLVRASVLPFLVKLVRLDERILKNVDYEPENTHDHPVRVNSLMEWNSPYCNLDAYTPSRIAANET